MTTTEESASEPQPAESAPVAAAPVEKEREKLAAQEERIGKLKDRRAELL